MDRHDEADMAPEIREVSPVTIVAGQLRTELGEGPIWDSSRHCLWFVDIMRGHVHRFDPASGADRVYEIGQPVGAVAPSTRGDLVCAVRDGVVRLDPENGRVTPFVSIEAELPRNRMNDGYCDARGRWWIGTLSMDREREKGALYRLDPDGGVTQHVTGVTTSNGIDWSGDNRRMYYVDTGTRRIDLFDFDLERGELSNRRVFATLDPEVDGKPDGLVVDAEDHVWLALWGGGRLIRFAPDGTRTATVRLPAALTTKPAFGGPDLSDLYVTSAFIELTADERAASAEAGALFHLRPGVSGRAPHCFGG
jgi:sugar lactone lactonase YvrE